MKAISLFQPYALLVVLGAKRLETRAWRTAHRGRIAVHACKLLPVELRCLCEREPFHSALCEGLGHSDWRELPLGALLGSVELLRCTSTDDLDLEALTAAERAFGDFGPGRWAWELTAPRPLVEPVAYRGRLGFFEVPDELFRI
ncbi:MAG: ASCH domain-containing protein [Gemmataceae bacterium]|nr:ASCH domain-containing protein [Gemmataceae bacterium]